jgi:hypothetical protein
MKEFASSGESSGKSFLSAGESAGEKDVFSMLGPVLRFFGNRQLTEEVTEETGNFSEKQAVKLETTEETTNETIGQIEAPSTHWNAQKFQLCFSKNFQQCSKCLILHKLK